MNLIPRKDKHYKDYLKDFLQMSKAIKLCQREDGFWNVSLHDPGNLVERKVPVPLYLYMVWHGE